MGDHFDQQTGPCFPVFSFLLLWAYLHILLVDFWPGFTVQIGSDSE